MPRKTCQVLLLCFVCLTGCVQVDGPPLDVVEYVDLTRYIGKWYEIASYPAPFQAGCVATFAEYSLREDGKIRVVNCCLDRSLDGPERRVEGVARVVDEQTNAKLKVSFFWPFEGDYWIIDLDEDYQWVVVGEPSRRYLWILSRTPDLDDAIYQDILSRLPDKNYDPAGLVKTQQPGDESN
ncbi:MAG: lipocalin family protein [Planctomycetota bacterium]|nr:MAG: lipocalin family protein [Planctomycetota bacterium]